MNINITILICFILFLLTVNIIAFFIVDPYLREKNNVQYMNADNAKMDLFLKLDPKLAEQELSQFIKNYIDEYVVKRFIIHKIEYINKENIEIMIKDLTKKIVVEIPELYVFYIKILINIENEDDLIKYIHKIVSDQVLSFTSEFNKPTVN